MKHILSFLLAMLLLMGLLPVNAMATELPASRQLTEENPEYATTLAITQQPQDATVPSGTTVHTTVEATGEDLEYMWYVKDPGETSFRLTSVTGNTFTTSYIDDREHGRQIYCWIYDKYYNSVKSRTATIRLSSFDPVAITSQPRDVSVPKNAIANVTLEAVGEGLQYKWYYKDPGASGFTPSYTNVSNTYSVIMTNSCDGRQVYCSVSNKYGSNTLSRVATLHMIPPPPPVITKQPEDVFTQEGNIVTVSVEATGDELRYAWYYKDIGDSYFHSTLGDTHSPNACTFYMHPSCDGRQLYCEITDSCGNSVTTNTVTLHLANDLVITQQPEKTVTVLSGETAKVTVAASGDELKYQWFVKMPGSSSYAKSSQTGTTYSVAMNASRSGMKVCCKITDKFGRSVTSEVATLKMMTPLAITSQPVSLTVLPGETAKVTVKAVGDGLKYQWFVKMPTSSGFAKGSQTGSTYSIKMTDARNGMQIYCIVTDTYGNSITSGVATLKQAAPLAITQQPKSVSVLNGEAAKVTVKATGEGLQYQWFVKMPGSSSYVKGSQTGTTYSVAMTAERNGMKVCCKITDKFGRSITSEVATLKQVTPLAITQQPKSVTVLNGATAKVTVKATGEGLKYQWYVKMPGSSSFAKGSQTSSTYSIQMTEARSGMQVRCIVTDKYGKSVTSEVATLKLPTPLAITVQPVSVTVADGAAARVTVKAAGDGLTYQWFVKMPTASGYSKSSQTGTTYSVAMNASRNGMKVCCKVTDQYGNSITSNAVTLRMG